MTMVLVTLKGGRLLLSVLLSDFSIGISENSAPSLKVSYRLPLKDLKLDTSPALNYGKFFESRLILYDLLAL